MRSSYTTVARTAVTDYAKMSRLPARMTSRAGKRLGNVLSNGSSI